MTRDTLDLRERFDFLGFTPEERGRLRALKPIVAETLPGVLDAFYQDIARHPDIDEMFQSADMRAHARQKQLEHWLTICEGEFGDRYLASVERIGRAHARLGLTPNWYFGGYSKIAGGLIQAVTEAAWKKRGRFGPSNANAVNADLAAVMKAAMLDMDLCMSTIDACTVERRNAERDRLADEFERSVASVVATVASASEQLGRTAQSMASIAEGTADKSSTVAAAAEEATVTARAVAEAANQLTAAIAEISKQSGDAAATAANARQDAQRTADTVEQLDASADKIGEIVNLIENVAEQTNLLALNATIEAARAGEAGKGFAVVASEVKSLAAQTAKATDEISRQISEVQGVVKTAVTAIEAVTGSIDQVNNVSTAISAAVEEQNAATAEISRNTSHTAESAGSVSETITEVLSGAQQTSGAAGEVVDAASSLGAEAERLKQDVAKFLEHIRAA